jgi:site-specific DNA recombinase
VKVALYARVSGREQAERGSIQTQIEFLERYCAAVGWEIVERFTDEPVSGTTDVKDRPDGGRMLRAAKKGKPHFEKVLVYKLDRLARSVLVLHITLAKLETAGVGLVSATESFDTTLYGRMMLNLLAVFAEWERDLIAERSLDGREKAARRGKLCGVPPLGYRTEEGFLVVDREPIPGCTFSEAELVERIFRMIVEEGRSVYAVAEALNAEKVPTAQACNYPRRKNSKHLATYWRHTTLQGIIHNPIYRGEFVYGKKREQPIRVPLPELAIVSAAVWKEAQFRLQENRKSTDDGHAYLLSGRLRCGLCGHQYTGVTHRDKYAYYVCAARNAPKTYFGPAGKPCPAPRLRVEELEDRVWGDIVRFASHPEEALDQLTADLNERRERADEIQEQVDHLTSLLKSCADHEREVTRLRVRGNIKTDEEMDELLNEIGAEKENLQARCSLLQARLDALQQPEEQLATAQQLRDRMRNHLASGSLTPAQQRRVVQTAVQELVVQEGADGWEVCAGYVFSAQEAVVQREQVATSRCTPSRSGRGDPAPPGG